MFQQEYQFWTSSWVALIVNTVDEKKTDRAYSVLDKFLGGTDCHYSRRKKKTGLRM